MRFDLFALLLTLPLMLLPVLSSAADATVSGPIALDPAGFPSRNMIFLSSAVPLREQGYVEEEYFMEGVAARYDLPEMETGAVLDDGHPYRTRLIVRRPENADRFNGVVVVEWLNVTGGTDKDIDWWQSGAHLVRNGYAYVAVSAQQVGVESLAEWSPERYGTLDVSHDGMVAGDDMSFDIFSDAGRVARDGGSGMVDILGGLEPEMLIATGHSQSAGRLATYLNSVHPLDPVYDGFMVHGGGGRIRDDQPVRIFKLMAETDMLRRAANPQPDTDWFRQWEVAGSSHVDFPFEVEWARVRLQQDGLPMSEAEPRDPGCELPPHSRVPFRDVMNAAFEHLVLWVRDGKTPPVAPSLQVSRMMPELEFARDEHGNVLGGIRLAAHAVPTARNTGMNYGGNRFCILYGSHHPFDENLLEQLYPDHDSYVAAVREVAEQNLEDGYILPYAMERTVRDATDSGVGR